QKKNPDLFELARARSATVASLAAQVRGLTHGLGSGYSKDLQELKEPLLQAFGTTLGTLAVMNLVVGEMEPNREMIEKAMSPELFATEHAYALVRKGMPFRQAYHQTKENLAELRDIDAEACVRSATHTGATGNLGLEQLEAELAGEEKKWAKLREGLHRTWDELRAFS
ncbi:MAG: hypothetical protein HQL31_10990, partial [Planctomycetes bacterium]|nr:hypothetical protein [Planctomycetota bacterium]